MGVEVGMQWRDGAAALRISSRTGRGDGDAYEERGACEERKHASSRRGAGYSISQRCVSSNLRATRRSPERSESERRKQDKNKRNENQR